MGKAKGQEYCPGYHDENNIWNNGFYCPRWGEFNDKYCCGSINNRFCCPPPPTGTAPPAIESHIPLIVAVAGGLVSVALLIIGCVLCPCCPVYKKRRKTRPPGPDVVEACMACSPHGPLHRNVRQGHLANGHLSGVGCHMMHLTRDAADGSPSDSRLYSSLLRGQRQSSGLPDRYGRTYPIDDPPPYTDPKSYECSDGSDTGHVSESGDEAPWMTRLPPAPLSAADSGALSDASITEQLRELARPYCVTAPVSSFRPQAAPNANNSTLPRRPLSNTSRTESSCENCDTIGRLLLFHENPDPRLLTWRQTGAQAASGASSTDSSPWRRYTNASVNQVLSGGSSNAGVANSIAVAPPVLPMPFRNSSCAASPTGPRSQLLAHRPEVTHVAAERRLSGNSMGSEASVTTILRQSNV